MPADLATAASGAANELEWAFAVGGVDAPLSPVRFQVTESLSQLYELQVEFATTDVGLTLGALVGKEARLTSSTPLGERYWHGIVRRAVVLGRARSTTRFRATVVPSLWFLTRRVDSRIFQAKSTPDILEEVLSAVGISGPALNNLLRRSYQPRDYCVQYRESDFAFVSRLMEEEGIYYFFVHSDAHHVLTLVDDVMAHDPVPDDPQVVYRPPSLPTASGQVTREVSFAQGIVPNQHALRDYTFKSPGTDLLALEGPASSAGADDDQSFEDVPLEIYEYPGDYVEAGLGAELARIRLEEDRTTLRELHLASNVRRLATGFTFELAEHPRPPWNRSYLLVSVSHEGTQPLADADQAAPAPTYQNTCVAIPEGTAFRPPRTTPRPTIPGIQTAIVTGPAGEEIHVDEFGRIKIRFHWDRLQPYDDTSSCWVRVSQGWAGMGFGHVFLPRIGQEVIVQFLEGDPDRPLVTGRVYNGDNALPYPLPDDKMKSTIKSSSTPGGGGFNEIRLDDTAGNEELFINGQYNATINTGNNKTETVAVDASYTIGSNSTISVGSNESTTVGSDRSVSVGANQTHSVGANRDISVGADEGHVVGANRQVSVGADETHTIGANQSLSVGANQTISVGADQATSVAANQSLTVGATRSISVGSSETHTVGSTRSHSVAAMETINVGGAQMVNVGGLQAVTVGAAHALSVGAAQATSVGGAQVISVGGSQTNNIGGSHTLTVAAKSTTSAGADASVKAGAKLVLDGGSETTVVCGGASVTLKGGKATVSASTIVIKASGSITIDGSGEVSVKGSTVKLN